MLDGLAPLEQEAINRIGNKNNDFFAYCWCDNEDYWDVYYYVVENVYNEFKRNNISIPYSQLEIRNRTDKVDMPYKKEPLPERVEKMRKEDDHFDLETIDLKTIVTRKRKNKKTQNNK